MFLIVGLGNPGSKYTRTRHNVGFRVVDLLASRHPFGAAQSKFRGEIAKGQVGERDALLLKPMTYMNLSGECVQAAMAFYRLSLADVLVVHDELDLPFGQMRLKMGGGAAGHNGLRSIVQHCGPDFGRLRIGIDRPPTIPAEQWVLAPFSSQEETTLAELVPRAVEGVELCLSEGIALAMNRFNQRI